MTFADLLEMVDYSRQKTLSLLETIAKQNNVQQILGWRPGPGRAHLGWQLMHIGATDDRHVNMRVRQGQAKEPRNIERFAFGSTPDDNIPTLDEIRRYLDTQRQELHAVVKQLDDKVIDTKPNDAMPWTYREWLKTLAWHEAHHQGQAHLTFNLYKAAHGLK